MEGMERKYGITEVGKEREDDMVRERKRKEKNCGMGGEGNIVWKEKEIRI